MEWITKAKSYERDVYGDVRLSISTDNSRKDKVRIVFTFYKGIERKIIKNLPYIMVGVNGSRLYFAETQKHNGFKLVGSNDRQAKYISMVNTHLKMGVKDVGFYNLNFDAEKRLYYIDLAQKIKTDETIDWGNKYTR